MNPAPVERMSPRMAGYGSGIRLGGRADSNPTEPDPASVRGRVLAALQSGRALTAGDAWRELGTSRLAAHVHALRGLGWRIVADTVPVPCADGRTARVALYRLSGGRP